MSPDVREVAEAASDSATVRTGARLGYAANGLLHLLIAWIAVQIAFGGRGRSADQSGAFATLSRQPLGQLLLWVALAGFVLLGLWQATEVVLQRSTAERLKAAGKAVAYLALAWTAATFALGGRANSDKQTRDVTASLLHQPGGQLAVGAVGAAVLGIGGYHVYKGWRKRFLRDLREHPGRVAEVSARVGYVAKGVALGVVGVLFLVAAVEHRSGKAGGLDEALRTLRDAPAGPALLVAIALGLAAYGGYSFVRARYARV